MDTSAAFLTSTSRSRRSETPSTSGVGRSPLRPHVLEAPRPAPDVFVCHLHVDLRLGTRTIDSCALGVGSSLQEAASQALELWASLVGVLVLSFLKQREFEGADHFDPEQPVPWGVPGMHGFVGPRCSSVTRVPAGCSAWS